MNKYLLIAQNTWDEMLTYRLNFTMYRIRTVLSFLTMYYLWLALLPPGVTLFGYTQKTMLTYVLGSALLNSFILASRSYAVGDDIINGNLSNFLMKPFNYFLYWFFKDLGDKAMNIVFATLELSFIFIFLRPPVIIQSDPIYLSLFIVAVTISIFLFFCFNLILGMIGFWSSEVWAPRFIFMIIIGFFSGGYFPIDILPESAQVIFRILPFQYLLFFPLKIYLNQVTISEIFSGLMIGLLWVSFLYVFVNYFWKKGLEVYTAQGR